MYNYLLRFIIKKVKLIPLLHLKENENSIRNKARNKSKDKMRCNAQNI